MEYEYVGGRRRDSKLLYMINEQQLYVRKSLYKNKVFYKCYFQNCKSRIFMTDGVCSKCGDFVEHNHGNQKAVYDELKLLNNIKRKCAESGGSEEVNALSGIRESFKSVCNSNQEASKNLNFSKIQRTLQKLRNTVHMTPPKTPAGVKEAFEDEAVLNKLRFSRHKGRDRTVFFKICHVEKDFAYCVFASEKCIQLIEKNIPINSSRKIVIDENFAAVQLGCFQQLLLISIDYMDRVFPFVFVLMENKTVKCYVHLFKFLSASVIDLNGAVFITDYGMSLRKAIKTEYPFSNIFESWFHYCQALRRHITTKIIGLSVFLRENKQASLQYHKILALPLLPRIHICSSFKDIKKDIEKCDYHLMFMPFLQYFETHWLEKIGPCGTSVFGATTRTTAALEAYNGVLGKIIPKHKNLFNFIQVLQNEEFSKSREFELLVNGGSGTSESSKCKNATILMECIDKATKIEKAACELLKGSMTAATFLDYMVFSENKMCIGMEPDDDGVEGLYHMKEETHKEEAEMYDEEADIAEECLDLESKTFVTCLVDEPNMLLLANKHIRICKECLQKVHKNSIAKKIRKFNCQACLQPLDDTIDAFL